MEVEVKREGQSFWRFALPQIQAGHQFKMQVSAVGLSSITLGRNVAAFQGPASDTVAPRTAPATTATPPPKICLAAAFAVVSHGRVSSTRVVLRVVALRRINDDAVGVSIYAVAITVRFRERLIPGQRRGCRPCLCHTVIKAWMSPRYRKAHSTGDKTSENTRVRRRCK